MSYLVNYRDQESLDLLQYGLILDTDSEPKLESTESLFPLHISPLMARGKADSEKKYQNNGSQLAHRANV